MRTLIRTHIYNPARLVAEKVQPVHEELHQDLGDVEGQEP